MSEYAFSSLKLNQDILSNLESLGYHSMTAIQAKSLPAILQGKDVIAQGQTGSGKTAAFALGLLSSLDTSSFKVQSLVLCPTRELAEQVANEIRRVARSTPNVKIVTLYGGTSMRPQISSLEHGAHIVVGTPGRIEDHLGKQTLDISQLKTLVLDEADRMLDMGFQKTLDTIIELLPNQRQTLMFSATYPDKIKTIAGRIMQAPVMIEVAPTQDTVRVDQHFFLVQDEAHRLNVLKALILDKPVTASAVFCNTRQDVQTVAGKLKSAGFSAAPLHGEMEQKDRDQTLIRFSNNSILILVATDVAARGLDVESLDMVINFHLPRELDVYTHRIGRTGRAGAKGVAYSLHNQNENFRVEQLEKHLSKEFVDSELPPEEVLGQAPPRPGMSTLRIEGGKKQKLRPGDIVGALTNGGELSGNQIGKIQVMDNWAYVAVPRELSKVALAKIGKGKLKGKTFRARLI
jgi:ATP-independent RNA helicase DbpA